MRFTPWVVWGSIIGCVACGGDDVVRRVDAGDDDAGSSVCRVDNDCSDGVFCNGVERCMPGPDRASDDGCVPGVAPRCDDGLACTTDTCSHVDNDCRFIPIDEDGDGHAAIACVTRDGDALGDDCDDADPQRFPGNPETCVNGTERHDEDCDETTFGTLDTDGDGLSDDACCNGDRCGDDCDDTRADVGAGYPEICDMIDNDCDGETDVETVEADWYPDADGDGFGRDVEMPQRSCAPLSGRSLFNTDLDDENPAINPAATEVCDGVDNDCDGAIDENEVCICGRPGATPCECTSGSKDCYGGLIPRDCIGGRWVTQQACRGRTPMCVLGECQCVGGGTACTNVTDRSPPFVIAAAPGPVRRVSRAAAVSILLSEPPAPVSVNDTTFQLLFDGQPVLGTFAIEGELLILSPAEELAPGGVHTVVLQGITDAAGNVLSETYSFQFTTLPLPYPREVIGDNPARRFTGPVHLDTNTAGETIAAAHYDAPSGGVITPHVEVFARSSDGQWTTRDLTSLDQLYVPYVGIGENGTHYALTSGDLNVISYFRGPNDSTWTEQIIGTAVQRAMTIGGDEMCVVSNLDGMTFHLPSPSGGFDDYFSSGGGNATGLAAAGNASRRYAAISVSDGAEVFYWGAPLGAIERHSYSIGAPGNQPDIAMNSAGRAVATWLEPRGRVGSTGSPPPTQLLAFVDETSASSSAIELATGGTHARPVVLWLSDGAVLAIRLDDHRVVVQRIEANGALGPAFALGEDVGGSVDGDVRAVATSNGDALVVWSNGASLAGPGRALLMARYVDGAFGPTEIIADTGVDGSLQAAPLPGGRVLVVWSQGGTAISGAGVVLP